MVNMDFKLGEWFKQVEQREQELKAKRKDGDELPVVNQEPVASVEPVIDSIQINEPALQTEEGMVATMTATEIIADTSVMDLSEPPVGGIDISSLNSGQPLFDEGEVPQVEDFFSFLGETGNPRPIEKDEEPPLDIPMGRRPLKNLNVLSEGTGEPRPISSRDDISIPMAAAPVVNLPKIETQPVVETKTQKKEVVQKQVAKTSTEPSALEENWARMPAHLQILFGNPATEVAQNSYKAFKEGRGDMIQRLLDPQLTLEEAARILNVCPTTVRRYTNRGALKHLRTAGNQRRFRLSDVLAFMETNVSKAGKQ